MCLSVPLKLSIAFVIGFLKGNSPVQIHWYLLKSKQAKGRHFRARGYCVSAVRLDQETVCKYIGEQEQVEKEQLDLE